MGTGVCTSRDLDERNQAGPGLLCQSMMHGCPKESDAGISVLQECIDCC